MKYQIDQSGKIEQTNKDTVLAYSNDNQYAVLIRRRVKRQLQEAFRSCGFTKLFIYYVFSVGIYYLLRNIHKESEVIIDNEYPGKDKIITGIVKALLVSYSMAQRNIRFARIGNHPKAHYAAKDVFDKKIGPNRILSYAEIINAIKKTDGRLRECLSTLVDVQPRPLPKIYHKKFKKSSLKSIY